MSEVKAVETKKEIPEKITRLKQAIGSLKERVVLALSERVDPIIMKVPPEACVPGKILNQEFHTPLGEELMKLAEEVEFIDGVVRSMLDRIQL